MFVEPMLLGKVGEPFDDERYIHEVKMDGHRLIFSHKKGISQLFTRHNNDCTLQYPELLHHVPTDDDVVLDGEVVCVPPGKETFEFEAVMDRFMLTKKPKIDYAARTSPVTAVIWDILELNGKSLRHLPLMERKRILSEVLGDNKYISKLPYFETIGTKLFEAVKARRWEGICSKPKSSSYVSGEAGRKIWKKIINYQYSEVILSGYGKKSFGWISLVENPDGSLMPGGVIELAITPKHRKHFYSRANKLVTGEDKSFVYLEPVMRGIVRHRGYTRNNLLRLPEFVDFVS
ncbi:ATP-dependent DNA ligase [Paenibacillus taichungensis]